MSLSVRKKQEALNSIRTTFGPNVIYCRVSSAPQANKEDGGTANRDNKEIDKVSLGEQERACLQKAAEEGITVHPQDIVKDIGAGELCFEAKGLFAIREAIEAGSIKKLIVYAVDRLPRNQLMVAVLLYECRRYGCQLIVVERDIDDSAEGTMYLGIMAYGAEKENQRRSDRAIMAARGRAMNGRLLNSSEKYGWLTDQERGIRSIRIEPIKNDGATIKVLGREVSEADVVRLIYNWYDKNGWSSQRIATHLNDLCVPAPGSNRDFKDGRKPVWHSRRIMQILSDSAYKGDAVMWQRKTVGKGTLKKQVMRDPSEHILIHDVTPAIIEPDLWERCQQRRKTNTGERTRNEKRPCLLRGLVYCGDCGNRMTVGGCTTSGGRLPRSNYRCYRNGSNTRPDAPRCKGGAVGVHIADPMVWEIVCEILRKPEILKAAVEKYDQTGPDLQLLEAAELIDKELEEIERGQNRLYSRLEREDDEQEIRLIEERIKQGKEKRKRKQTERDDLLSQYTAQEKAHINYYEIAEMCYRTSRNLDKIDFNGRRELFEKLGVKVFLNTRKNVEVKMRFDTSLNRFLDEVDEPITVYYRDDRENNNVRNEGNSHFREAPLQDNRRADGSGCGAARR